MGPPMVAPNWFWMSVGFWLLTGLKKPVALRAVLRRYSYTEPWNWFVPERMEALMTAPPARPNSAEKLLVSRRNSCTASGESCTT